MQSAEAVTGIHALHRREQLLHARLEVLFGIRVRQCNHGQSGMYLREQLLHARLEVLFGLRVRRPPLRLHLGRRDGHLLGQQ